MAGKIRIFLINQRFNRLIVIREDGKASTGDRLWFCVCDCGGTITTRQSSLRNGTTQSCGCLGREKLELCRTKHGLSRTRTYVSWNKMLDRVRNQKSDNFPQYGGRGIDCDPRWEDFANFLADLGERPKGTSLDRKNGKLGYWPDNCHWATIEQQNRNTTRNRIITYNGVTKVQPEWADDSVVECSVFAARITNGWSMHDALTLPLYSRKRRSSKQDFIISSPLP